MKPKPTTATDAARGDRAETTVRAQDTKTGSARTEADIQRLVHELQVHQVQLEMQNEELRQARDRVESEMEKYSDLYDFAPVSYVTLDRAGVIQEANLTCASLLGVERSQLVRRHLALLIEAADLLTFRNFLEKVFAGKAKVTCDVAVMP